MESAPRLPADTRNIPHMQLFHHLKQKFPDLRDNDVNESIQKYGLDRERCEEELSQKAAIHHGSIFRHWSRSGSTFSSPPSSGVVSPIRTGIPSTPTTPVITTTSPSTPFHHTTATQHVFGPVQSNGYLVYTGTYDQEMVPEHGHVYTSVCPTPVTANPVLYSPVNNAANYGWHPSVSNGFRAAGVLPPRPGVTPYNPEDTLTSSSREPSHSRSVTPVPSSAPVIPNSFEPFSAYENRDQPERRKSAETRLDQRKGLFYNRLNFENFTSPHSPTPPINNSAMDSPSTSTTTTTTFTNPRSSNVDAVNINGGNLNRPPPVVQEQGIRKQKLETELAKQLQEKGKLESEVEMLKRELNARETQRKRNADSNALRIEEVQHENQRLQYECDEMENKILRIAPDLGQDDYADIPTSQPCHEPPGVPQLTRASSGSSLGSGTGTPQTPHTPYTPIIPQRPAPPPPPPPPMPNSYQGFTGVPSTTGEEAAPKWGCTKCTFINHPDMNKCEMCECPRFTIGTTTSHHAGLPPHHQGPCYCHRQHAPGAVAGSIGTAAVAYSPHRTYSSLPLVPNEKPSLTNILKEKLIGLRDRSDSV